MDLYVERQCVEKMKQGELKQFMLLFEAYFAPVYKYVTRRVAERSEAERIIRMTFFDAIGQVRNTPSDISYVIWLYSLAKPRVHSYLAQTSFPEKQGLMNKIDEEQAASEDALILQKFEKMMKKLSLDEREIVRLKFSEQVADGEVMSIMQTKEADIGPKIYRVLKRVHLLLFGESDERTGVYFGELSGFMERVKNLEDIEVSEVLKLTLKTELLGKIEKKDFAIEAEGEVVSGPFRGTGDVTAPFEVKDAEDIVVEKTPITHQGSHDPAKIFVEAVEEMRQEEALKKIQEDRKAERRENFVLILEQWKGLLLAIPALLFVIAVGIVLYRFTTLPEKVERGYLTDCEIEVSLEGDFSDNEIRNIHSGIGNKICGHFDDVSAVRITKEGDGKVFVEVSRKEWFLEYNFVRKELDYRIKKYARSLVSNGEPGEV